MPTLALWVALHGTGCTENSKPTSASRDGLGVQLADPSDVWLTDVADEWGVEFTSHTGAKGALHMYEIMGGGVALLDYDNDNDLDIYLINGQDDPNELLTGNNRLYRQDSPGHFTDVTEEAGVGDPHYGMGCAVGDIDNDGDVDIYVTNYGPDQLYVNNGDGTFTNDSVRAGVHVPHWSVSASFLDYNRDGFLDLFVTQYVHFDPDKKCTDEAGRPEYCGPMSFPPVSDVLLHNNGNGTFTDVSEKAGLHHESGAGLGVVCADFNNDDWTDIYVANDGYDNHLWINQQNEGFRNDAMLLGVAMNMHGQEEAGMGVIAADFDDDLDLDLLVTHLVDETNTLYRNHAGRFDDATGAFGLAAPSFATTGFGVVALDVESDGDLDIAIANGRVTRANPRDDACASLPWNRYSENNLFFLNENSRYQLSHDIARDFVYAVEISRGLAAGDLDNDGDLDLVLNNIECPARIFRNDAPNHGHWLQLRLVDRSLNRDMYGATVTISAHDARWFRSANPGSSYVASNDPRIHVGLGTRTTVDWIDVRWPDGTLERFDGGAADRLVTLYKGEGVERVQSP